MRELVFDTYRGEGRVVTNHPEYPGFRHVYMKVAEGANGYLTTDKVTLHNALEFQLCRENGKLDTFAPYLYFRNHTYVHWQKQAEAYLGQLDALDSLSVETDYDILDLEPYNNATVHPTYGWWVFPAQFGSWVYEYVRFVTDRTQRPFMLYGFGSAIYDMFDRFGYRWHRDYPWIIAQYPSYGWDEELHNNVLSGELSPRLRNTEYLREQVVMWQYSDKYPVNGWQLDEEGNIGSHHADVNVWLADWRVLLNKPAPVVKKDNDIKRAWRRMKFTLNRER